MNIIEFLASLSENNNREWFGAHRKEYEAVISKWYSDLDIMIEHMAKWEPRILGLTGKASSYRIYRNLRLSPDKTPYKTFLAASYFPYGKKVEGAGYYIQCGPVDEKCLLGGGIWSPETKTLNLLRKAMVDNIEEFKEIINEPELNRLYPYWEEPRLVTAPKGWPRNHPNIDLLRLLHIGRCHYVTTDFFLDPKWPVKAAELLRPLKPMVDFINYTLHEENAE